MIYEYFLCFQFPESIGREGHSLPLICYRWTGHRPEYLDQESSLTQSCTGITELMVVHEKLWSHSSKWDSFITGSTCNNWSETGTTWCFFMKTTSKEFTLSSDFKWIHLLSENSSDIGKNKSDFICFGGGTSNFTETANKAEISEL